MFNRACLLACLTLLQACCLATRVHADVILSYGNSTGTIANHTAPSVTAATISQSGLMQQLNLSWDGFSNGFVRTVTDYVEWSFMSTTFFDLSDLQLNLERTSSGPDMLDLLVSVNNGAFTKVGDTLFATTTLPTQQTVDLSSLAAANSATFRLHGYSAQGVSGQLYLRDHAAFGANTALVLNGTAVPEPAMGGGVLLAFLALVQRRRK